jgi:hypothetical protein
MQSIHSAMVISKVSEINVLVRLHRSGVPWREASPLLIVGVCENWNAKFEKDLSCLFSVCWMDFTGIGGLTCDFAGKFEEKLNTDSHRVAPIKDKRRPRMEANQ